MSAEDRGRPTRPLRVSGVPALPLPELIAMRTTLEVIPESRIAEVAAPTDGGVEARPATAAVHRPPVPSSAAPAAARHEALDSALQGAKAAADAVGGAARFLHRVGRALYRAALWVDSRARGRRVLALTLCLTLAAVFHILARVTEAAGWVVLDNALLAVFALLALTFFVGRVLSWESEDEGGSRWPGWDAFKELLGGVRGVWDTFIVCFNAWARPGKKNRGRERLEATANLFALIGPPLYLWGRFTDSGLDFLAALALAGAVGFRLLKVVVARYQRSLARHLAGSISMDVSPEHTYYDDRTRCRFDRLLGEAVVLEMKTDLGRSDQRDRATGQIRRYA